MRFLLSGPGRSNRVLRLPFHHAFTTSSSSARVAKKKSSINPKFKKVLPAQDRRIGILKNDLGIENTHPTKPQFRRPGPSDGPFAIGKQNASKTYAVFERLISNRWSELISTDFHWSRKQEMWSAFGLHDIQDFERERKLFRNTLQHAFDLATTKDAVAKQDNPLFWQLRNAFVTRDIKGLSDELVFAFQNFLMRSRFPSSIASTHQKLADFRYPYEWFPATRALQRTIHLHVGPTNSGKTYHALKALENAKSGMYAGPLRLLAHEVYTRFLAKGLKCALVTGEEQRIPDKEDSYFKSCTVEMTPLNTLVDVAVIDEIQMIGDAERGWAWTQAVLGVQARELHLCGEERAVELIQALCATTGDKCVVHRYQRLSPLSTMDNSLKGNLGNLEKGDAVVSFSRVGIHALKNQIEKATGKHCAMVYGSLPPETRAQQAALFNDPNNDYDYLVASDAIGMGLNLEIKRVIFEQTHKRDSVDFREMTVSEIKQIGGRAGRFKSANQAINPRLPGQPKSVGLVTALEDADLEAVRKAFRREPEPLKTAGIQPPPSVIERFSTYFPPNTPLSYILNRLRDIALLSQRYHLCTTKESLEIADLIQPFPMTVYDRCVFLSAPVSLRDQRAAQVLQAFARCVSKMGGGDLLDIEALDLGLLDVDPSEPGVNTSFYLRNLEALHKSITLYLWLTYRYSGVFRSQALAFHVKFLVEEKINHQLEGVRYDDEAHKQRLKTIRKQAQAKKRKKSKVLGAEVDGDGDGDGDGPPHEGAGQWNEEGHEEPLLQDPAELKEIRTIEPTSEKSNNQEANV
ncbi:P-loop containing nucleoside triphosphate hydrolase protein [Xylariomycetidae sp. FL0641]|nr:P-loop containing nucleoside triphosphate hydrolase protein [Xylariomycetidae sp. FL0641]